MRIYCPSCGHKEIVNMYGIELTPSEYNYECPNCHIKYRVSIVFTEVINDMRGKRIEIDYED